MYSPADRFILGVDTALRTVFGQPKATERSNPADGLADVDLDPAQRREVEGLMRVNHSGEVAAQALYQGQALTARSAEVRSRMERSAQEENDHLIWCEQRVREMGGQTSLLNPLWYAGSFAIGAAAGLAGDRWSLGFVAETEHQVISHLDSHLARLADDDVKTRAILEQMKEDEAHHADVAVEQGAAPLPGPIRRLMGAVSKLMTGAAYRL